MPYSTYLPIVVFPDNHEGHIDAKPYQVQEVEVAFCDEYRPEYDRASLFLETKNPCRVRRAEGKRSNNWCFRCMAGFPFWIEDDPDADDLCQDRAISI